MEKIKYTLIGSLKSGEDIFYASPVTIAIERDHQYLSEPTDEELDEVYSLFPHLKHTNLTPPPSPCRWLEDDEGNWDTECKNTFVFPDGGPAENRMQYCCYCGKDLIPIPFPEGA